MVGDDHGVYRNAPIALVAAEIRLPGEIGSPVPQGVRRALAEILGDEWVIEQAPQTRIEFNLGGTAPVVSNTGMFPSESILRFTDRGRTTAIAITAGSVTVQSTRYHNWSKFREVLEMSIRATEKLLRPTGVIRAGIRYIDEVRVGGVEDTQWANWLSPTILSPCAEAMANCGWIPSHWTGAAQYRIEEDRHLVIRYGPQASQPGFVVDPNGPLRRPDFRPVGPFFLLDFDSSWLPMEVPAWDSERLLEVYDQLREPIRVLFKEIVTQQLIDNVFNKESKRGEI